MQNIRDAQKHGVTGFHAYPLMLLACDWGRRERMRQGPVSEPLVTVVIAAYQAERFLAEALESVRAQSFRRREVVLVNDGSTDATSDVAGRFSEVRELRLAENRGVSAARNAGVAAASGDLVTFLDADDVMFPNRLEVQVRHLLEHPDCRCVLARHEFLVEAGQTSSWLQRDPIYGDLGGVEPGSAMLWADVAKAVPFDPDYRVGEGLEWLGRVADLVGPIEVCAEPLWRRRLHGRNQSLDRDGLRRDMLRMARSRIREVRGRSGGT
jgi:glycosyltransferase involved in cell wall biosynthesis